MTVSCPHWQEAEFGGTTGDGQGDCEAEEGEGAPRAPNDDSCPAELSLVVPKDRSMRSGATKIGA